MSIEPKSFLKLLAIVAVAFVTISGDSIHADTLASVESSSPWGEQVIQSSVGIWSMVDSPNALTSQGKLVDASQNETAVARAGLSLLDLGRESLHVSGGELDFFTPARILQTTNLLSSNGDVVALIGLKSLGTSVSPAAHYSIDGNTWSDAGLIADLSLWKRVSVSLDMDSMKTSVAFTEGKASASDSAKVTPTQKATSREMNEAALITPNVQRGDEATKTYLDKVSVAATLSSAHEPSTAIVMAIGFLAVSVRRRGK